MSVWQSESSLIPRSLRHNDIPFSPFPLQSIPSWELPVVIWSLFTSASVSMGDRPLFSASASGMASSAAEKARMAYCSIDGICREFRRRSLERKVRPHLIRSFGYSNGAANVRRTPSVHDPVVHHEVSHDADGIMQRPFSFVDDLRYLSTWEPRETRRQTRTILLLPLTKIVTAREFAHSSITSILSLVVPNEISRTIPALPNFSGVSSSNLGTMRPCVAIAMSFVRVVSKANR